MGDDRAVAIETEIAVLKQLLRRAIQDVAELRGEVKKQLERGHYERGELNNKIAVLTERIATLKPPPSKSETATLVGIISALMVGLVEAARALSKP